MTDKEYPPTPPCSISVEVYRPDDGFKEETFHEAVESALQTKAGEMFKDGSCRELIVLFHSVGPHH